jgi:dolichol-phosphate mannosyltransferase
MAKQIISYIFPIFNESGNIDLLYEAMGNLTETRAAEYDFEFIFVNDGSRDNSLAKLVAIQQSDTRVCVINLSRNFGHQIAVSAGLDYANGDAAIIMDSDLQDPPAVSLRLVDKWQEGYDVVYAQRRTRKDGIFKKLTANLFYRLLERLSEINIPRDTGDFRLIDRKVVDELKRFPEHNRFLRGMVSFVGFKQTAVLFDRDERYAGKTGYPLGKMIRFAFDGIFGFSSAPLKLITRVGYFISLLSFVAIGYVLWVRIYEPSQAVSGWAFTVIAILFIGGVQLIMLGILGGYIGRIYTEAQGRPLYIVDQVISSSLSHPKKD